MFSQIGGIFEILMLAGGFLVGLFSGKMYMSSLMSNLYHIEDEIDYHANESNKIEPHMSEVPNEGFMSYYGNSHPTKSKTGDKLSPKFSNSWSYDPKRDELIQKVKSKIDSRRSYKSSWKDLVYSLFCCPNMRCSRTKPKR